METDADQAGNERNRPESNRHLSVETERSNQLRHDRAHGIAICCQPTIYTDTEPATEHTF